MAAYAKAAPQATTRNQEEAPQGTTPGSCGLWALGANVAAPKAAVLSAAAVHDVAE